MCSSTVGYPCADDSDADVEVDLPGPEYHFQAELPLGMIDLWCFGMVSETRTCRRVVLQHERPGGTACRYIGKTTDEVCKDEAPDGFEAWLVQWSYVASIGLSDTGMNPNVRATKAGGFKRIKDSYQCELVEKFHPSARASFHCPVNVEVLMVAEAGILLSRVGKGGRFMADEALRLVRVDCGEQVSRFPMMDLVQRKATSYFKPDSDGGDLEVFVTLLSGRSLPSIRVGAYRMGFQLKASLASFIDKEACVTELRDGERILRNEQTLGDFNVTSAGSVELQAVVGNRPLHDLWHSEFMSYSPCQTYLRKMIVTGDPKTASTTIQMIRNQERAHMQVDEASQIAARMQLVRMCKDASMCADTDDEVVLVPSDSTYDDEKSIVNVCRSCSVDAVVIGSGTIANSDANLVSVLKVALAEAGLQVLVFGKCLSLGTSPEEPSGGWKELPTTPPSGARAACVCCVYCRDLQADGSASDSVEGELGEYMSAWFKADGYPCASWFFCTSCGAACVGPDSNSLVHNSVGSLIGGAIYGSNRGYVFSSSSTEAAGITFALTKEFTDGWLKHELVVVGAAQIDGEWIETECTKEQGSFLGRMRALKFVETTTPGPGKSITFKAIGHRKCTEEEAQVHARLAGEHGDEEEEEEDEIVDIKSGKWLGFSRGIQWDDGEMWSCLGILKPEDWGSYF